MYRDEDPRLSSRSRTLTFDDVLVYFKNDKDEDKLIEGSVGPCFRHANAEVDWRS